MNSRGHDNWFVTRPKRSLKSVPEILNIFAALSYHRGWSGNRLLHIQFEKELEEAGLKRIGSRLDAAGSGGRTYAAMLYALGLWFEYNDTVHLTLAGEAIMKGESFVAILSKQVLAFQYPSPYSLSIGIDKRFHIRPCRFLLRLLADSSIGYLSEDEIARVVISEANEETEECVRRVTASVLHDREMGNGKAESNLKDIANTFMNWMDITGLTSRSEGKIRIPQQKMDAVMQILAQDTPLIKLDKGETVFQQRYGLDLIHQKDTRNLLDSNNVIWATIEQNRILKTFDNCISQRFLTEIDMPTVEQIAVRSGASVQKVADVLYKRYPHGTYDTFFLTYREMAFAGRDKCIPFEIETAELFRKVFGYEVDHLGQGGSKSVPDVVPYANDERYFGVIDTKAYSEYSITGDHHNRMVVNYLQKSGSYVTLPYQLGFFQYVAGGFCNTIDRQIQSIESESGCHGSAITVFTMQELVNKALADPIPHRKLLELFTLDRQITLEDINNI